MTSLVRSKRHPLDLPKSIEIKVGILDEGKSYEGGMTVRQVAEAHEFGYGVPTRSWLRGWFDEKQPELKRIGFKAIEQALPTSSWGQAADLIATIYQASIRDRIQEEKPFKPLAEATEADKKRRGFDPPYTPLVEYGFLLNSIIAVSEVKP